MAKRGRRRGLGLSSRYPAGRAAETERSLVLCVARARARQHARQVVNLELEDLAEEVGRTVDAARPAFWSRETPGTPQV